MENPHHSGQSCHLSILFPPSSLSHVKNPWASHIQFYTKLHQISFLSQIYSLGKNNGINSIWQMTLQSVFKVYRDKVYFTQAHFRKQEKSPHLLFQPHPFQIISIITPVFFSFKIKLATWTLSNKRNKTHRTQWALSYHTSGQLAKRNRRKTMIRLSLGKQSWSVT